MHVKRLRTFLVAACAAALLLAGSVHDRERRFAAVVRHAERGPDSRATGRELADPPGRQLPAHPVVRVRLHAADIQARSNGRMDVKVIGQSALGRDLYLVTINALDTNQQRRDFQTWQNIRKIALTEPARAQGMLDRAGDDVKVPIFVQSAIHGNESEGVDAMFDLVERLATTPYGTDPEVDAILDHVVLFWNVDQNPDGRIANTRANGNNFDLNRDFLTQSQSETKASVSIMQEWLPPDMLDQHGYVTPTLIESTTKPHNPSIDYDLWLKWNVSRIDANEAAMNAVGLGVTRPILDWCANGDPPPAERHLRRRQPARASGGRRAGTTGGRSTRRCTRSSSA